MIMNAVVSSKAHPEYGQTTIPLPIPDNQYDSIIDLLEAMDIGSPAAQDCRVDEVDSRDPILNRLAAQSVNVDELDYLAKRLDCFSKGENEKFEAMASKLGLSDIKDLINLTFCCQQATVITDFSKLEQAGKDHTLAINGGSMPLEEFKKVDGLSVALDLIQGGAGVVTPYGVVYDNGMKLEPCYNGGPFPMYGYGAPQIALELRAKEGGADAGCLYLPAPDQQIRRTLQRAGLEAPEDVDWKVIWTELPEGILKAVNWDRESILDMNELCRAVDPLDGADRTKLEAAVLLARPKSADEVRRLAESLDQFDFMPKGDGPQAVGKATRLGYVAYHGSLTLEELMRGDPAEQYRQEPELGQTMG